MTTNFNVLRWRSKVCKCQQNSFVPELPNFECRSIGPRKFSLEEIFVCGIGSQAGKWGGGGGCVYSYRWSDSKSTLYRSLFCSPLSDAPMHSIHNPTCNVRTKFRKKWLSFAWYLIMQTPAGKRNSLEKLKHEHVSMCPYAVNIGWECYAFRWPSTWLRPYTCHYSYRLSVVATWSDVGDGGGIDCRAALYNYGTVSVEKHQKANGILIFVLGDGVKGWSQMHFGSNNAAISDCSSLFVFVFVCPEIGKAVIL